MDARTFVSHFKKEKDAYLRDTFASEASLAGSQRRKLVAKLGSDDELKAFVDTILTDAYYTILLALDGSATLGGLQHSFKILTEDGNPVSESGDIEAEAYEAFHEAKK